MTQAARILEAVRNGARTPGEVADDTGIRKNSVAAHVSHLCRRGLLRRVGSRRELGAPGRAAFLYEVASRPPADSPVRIEVVSQLDVRCWGAGLTLKPEDLRRRHGTEMEAL